MPRTMHDDLLALESPTTVHGVADRTSISSMLTLSTYAQLCTHVAEPAAAYLLLVYILSMAASPQQRSSACVQEGNCSFKSSKLVSSFL